MAQKRMIDKKICISEQVANLPIEAQLIFTWAIPHSDDFGLLPYSKRTLKAMIVPMWDKIDLETFGNHWEAIVSEKLINVFQYRNEKFYKITKFSQNQTLKKDRQPQTLLKDYFIYKEKPLETWNEIYKIFNSGNHLEDTGKHLDTEVKRSKDKIREDKINSNIENLLKKYLEIKDIKNKTNQQYIKKLSKRYTEEQIEILLKGIKYFNDKDPQYSYVIESARSLWEKREKIILRIKKEQISLNNQKGGVAKI